MLNIEEKQEIVLLTGVNDDLLINIFYKKTLTFLKTYSIEASEDNDLILDLMVYFLTLHKRGHISSEGIADLSVVYKTEYDNIPAYLKTKLNEYDINIGSLKGAGRVYIW